MKTLTFKLLTLTFCVAMFAACKKNNPNPEVITKTDTLRVTDTVHAGVITKTDTIIKTDTVTCIPLSDIIEGTWYNYGYERNGVVTQTTVYAVNFTDSTYSWQGEVTNAPISFSSDYSIAYINSGPEKGQVTFNVVGNCSTLSLTQPSNVGTTYLLRRN